MKQVLLLNEFGKIRTQKGFSARNLSLLIGKNPGYITDIERGKSQPPLDVFIEICSILHISPLLVLDISPFFDSSIKEVTKKIQALSPDDLDKINKILTILIDLHEII